jgi:hypothetical protein
MSQAALRSIKTLNPRRARPIKRRGRTLSFRARGADTQAFHGPLQRLLEDAGVEEAGDINDLSARAGIELPSVLDKGVKQRSSQVLSEHESLPGVLAMNISEAIVQTR